MAYKRRDDKFNSRLCAIANRKRQQPALKPKRSRLIQVFESCVRALLNR